MKFGRMQCKDIPDEVVIQAIRNTKKLEPTSWRMWWDVQEQFELLMPNVPKPLLYAKADKMKQVHGCVHHPYSGDQCRGDVHLAEECVEGPACH